VSEVLAILAAIVAAGCAALYWRGRARWRAAAAAAAALARSEADFAAILDTVPLAWFRWPERDGRDAAAYAEFLGRLPLADATRLEAARRALDHDGTPFSVMVAPCAGGALLVEGRRAGAKTVLWLLDHSAVRAAEAAGATAASEAAQLREALDAIPLPVWRRAPDLTLADCNRAYLLALEAPRETVLAERRELVPSGARRAVAPGPRSERGHVVVGGSRRLVEITERPSADGGAIGFALDHTDVETAEAELWRHVNAHAEVLESIHAAVAIYGADQRLKFCNAGFAELWGVEEDWLAGEPSFEEILERLRERRRIPEMADFRAFKRQQLDMFTSLIEAQQELMHLPDGRTLRLSVSPHPFGGLTFVYEDVTDRLALERSYNTLTEVQRATLDHLYEGIAVYGSDGRLKLHNPAYREIWGLSEQDLAGEPHISEIVEKTRPFFADPGDWPALKERIIAQVTAHAPSSGPLDRRDGSVLQVATVPLPDGNVLSTSLDITDSTRVERALRERNEALETAGRLKSEFIANVSYELRTPLNAVIGFAEILANQYFGALNPRQLDYSRGILDSAHQLMALINDILDLATIEAGYLLLEPRHIDVAEMMQAVATLTRERARNQNLALTLHCPPDIGTIEADERRLKQALFNLISNATKFTPAGGTITVAVAREGDELRFCVADTGVGIAEDDQARMFEKFERGTRQAGAGLGLSLVKSLVELHGGAVEIDSAPGRGTTVTCRLPATPAQAPALAGAA
jgi:signal transduction histidine kinase